MGKIATKEIQRKTLHLLFFFPASTATEKALPGGFTEELLETFLKDASGAKLCKRNVLSGHCIVNIKGNIIFYEYDIWSLWEPKIVGTLKMTKEDNTFTRVVAFMSLLTIALK